MNRVAIRVVLVFGALAACSSPCADRAPERVATFERTPLLVAYYRSAVHRDVLRALEAERDAARARGDVAAAEACERRGEAAQDLAHRQLARQAPLDNVLAALAPHLGRVAADVGAARVVEREDAPPGAVAVDVTEALAALLPPAPRAR